MSAQRTQLCRQPRIVGPASTDSSSGGGRCLRLLIRVICVAALAGSSGPATATAQPPGQDVSIEAVTESIELARNALIREQSPEGTWAMGANHVPGATALVTLALINSGMDVDSEPIQRALKYLRDSDLPTATYDASLALMVYAALKDRQDRVRMRRLVKALEDSQIQRGPMAGCWSYFTRDALIDTGGDNSNGQFAVLGLFEAAHAGIPVNEETWQRARDHWRRNQGGDGGWSYTTGDGGSTSSMTVAGLAALVMSTAMLPEVDKLDADGNPNCCQPIEDDESLQRALRWMANHFSVSRNAGNSGWLYYYLYGLERAGRLSGRRFFGENDWYREGARFLMGVQNKRTGNWDQGGGGDSTINTAFGLLFMSKGLAPVLINKLKFKSVDAVDENWNQQPNDVRNLTDRITGADGWPKLMTWQILDLPIAAEHGSVSDLNQSPVLYLAGRHKPVFSDREIELLREYVNLGGFILAVNNCGQSDFEAGVHDMVGRMYPNGETSLQRLTAEHPVYRSEYLLGDADAVELWGADFGCRTAIMYSPDDVSCLWQRWSRAAVDNRPAQFKGRVERAMRVGTNIIAYATGREPANKLERDQIEDQDDPTQGLRRGLLQVAQLHHEGGHDTAPRAARNLLLALNKTIGIAAATDASTISLNAENLFDYSLLIMHGRTRFAIPERERERLREYLSRGRVLFADACCGSPEFDRSFRTFIEQLYPGRQLERIDPNDEMFTAQVGHDLARVRRRIAESLDGNTIKGNEIVGPPFLEGIKVNGRYVVIYSKYDISCALERQASVACTGYVSEDAVRIAVNVVIYSMLTGDRVTAN